MGTAQPVVAPVIVPARNSADDYADVLRKLLPRGRVWTREDEGVQAAVLRALGVTAQSIDSAALTLIAAAFPATATEFLPEWDETLGLPDPCFGPFANDDENRQQVVAKFIGTGGQSAAYFESLAASLGCSITITEYTPHTVIRPVTTPIAGEDWASTWLVSLTGTAPARYHVVTDPVEDPLSKRDTAYGHYHTVSDPVEDALSSSGTTPTYQILECLLRRYAPAQTVMVFAYT